MANGLINKIGKNLKQEFLLFEKWFNESDLETCMWNHATCKIGKTTPQWTGKEISAYFGMCRDHAKGKASQKTKIMKY